MIDALKEEQIVNGVGGRFKLSALIQKRLVALNAGARPLVTSTETEEKMEVVIREVLSDKIYLDASTEFRVTGESQEIGGGPPELDLPSP